MNIRLIAYYNPPKLGMGKLIDELVPRVAERLSKDGHTIELITNKGMADHCSFSLSIFSRVTIVPSLSHSVRTILWMLLYFPFYALRHPASATLFLSNPLITPLTKNTYAIINDLNEFENPKKYGTIRSWYRRNIMLRLSCRSANHLIAISKHTEGQIGKYLGRALILKTTVIPCGIPIRIPEPDQPKKSHSNPYLLTVGRLDPDGKNLWEALNLFRLLRTEEPGLEWKLVGGIENPLDQQRSSQFLEMLRLETGVQVLGYVSSEELALLYQGALATLFYSKQEGFGFPLLESFSHGCPVLTHPDNLAAQEIGGGLDIVAPPTQQGGHAGVANLLKSIRDTDPANLISHAAKFDWDNTSEHYCSLLTSRPPEATLDVNSRKI